MDTIALSDGVGKVCLPDAYDADYLVVFDVFVPVALGIQKDLYRTFLIFDTQFVKPTATV